VRDGGLPPITLHGVRHSYATAALAAGEPLTVVSERLGHASSSITANLYQHVLPSTDERTANAAASRSVRLLAPAIGCRQGQAAKPNAPAVLIQRRCRTHRLGDVGAVRRSTYASPSWATASVRWEARRAVPRGTARSAGFWSSSVWRYAASSRKA
jgi:hypothetical protein